MIWLKFFVNFREVIAANIMKEYWPYIFNEMIFKIFEIFATFKAIYLILIVMNYSRLKVCFVIFFFFESYVKRT